MCCPGSRCLGAAGKPLNDPSASHMSEHCSRPNHETWSSFLEPLQVEAEALVQNLQAACMRHAGARPAKPFPTGTAVHPLQPAQQHQPLTQPQQQQLAQQGVNWTQVSTAHCLARSPELSSCLLSAKHRPTAGGMVPSLCACLCDAGQRADLLWEPHRHSCALLPIQR